MHHMKYPVKRGEILNVNIENVAFGGKGISKIEDFVIFVSDTLPGDKVKVKVIKRKPGYAEAKLLSIIDASPIRQEAPCEYFKWCGGCTWQNVDYNRQIEFKWNHVKDSLKHITGLESIQIPKPVLAQNIWAYRNKMEFSFADKRWLLPEELENKEIDNSFALGLHIPGTYDKILSIDKCMLQSDVANQILNFIQSYCKNNNLIPYGIKSHQGFLRFLVIRESSFYNDIMINIVTAYHESKILNKLAIELSNNFPVIKSIVNTINERKAQIAYGEKEYLLFGEPYIKDKIFDFEFKVSANSFFQTNTKQAEKLYNIVKEFSELNKVNVVWDLYCGTGTMTIILAKYAKNIIGFELNNSAISDAKKNAKEFGIKNVKFIQGDVLDNISQINDRPDVLIIDPPRSGLHPKVAKFLNESNSDRIVYVSCNPTTLARDLRIILQNYKLKKLKAIDMFPQTYHIECVALLEKNYA